MPLIEHDKLIKEYYESVKDKYPHVDIDKFTAICKAPFHYIAKQMARMDMPIIHIKYFGKFIVFSSYIKKLLRKLEDRKKFGVVSSANYIKKKEFLLERLKEVEADEYTQSLLEIKEEQE